MIVFQHSPQALDLVCRWKVINPGVHLRVGDGFASQIDD
jgi:hypothetical protein